MHLTLHLTGRCNLRCRYCYADPARRGHELRDGAGGRRSGGGAHAEVLPDQSVGLIFFGGEPLLSVTSSRSWCATAAGFEGQDFHFKMTTNGTLLDEAVPDRPRHSEVFVALEP